ncbi:MAG: DapH/DapD/GlmU-related protein [Thermodesulfobacteriota bacterium]
MKKYRNKTPEEVMRAVTTELIERAIKMGNRKGRSIFISKTSGGQGVDVGELNPKTREGRESLEKFLTPVRRHYTIYGLGSQEEAKAINWRILNLPFGRRAFLILLVGFSFFLKGTPWKNKFLRRMGVHIGKGTEIMQMVWLDHFRPELIFIGENTLVGAFNRLTVHAYEGAGKFRYGLIEIGNHCTLGAGSGIGPIKIEDNVRILPNTTLSPYLSKIRSGSIVGWNPPSVKREEKREEE